MTVKVCVEAARWINFAAPIILTFLVQPVCRVMCDQQIESIRVTPRSRIAVRNRHQLTWVYVKFAEIVGAVELQPSSVQTYEANPKGRRALRQLPHPPGVVRWCHELA
jgi:hypothetical protein